MRRILWQWWKNPLGGGQEWQDNYKEPPKKKKKSKFYFDEEPGKDLAVRPVVASPVGLVPITVYGNMAENFNFWIGSTNFKITNEVRERIKSVDGVEALDFISQYRFRLGIGLIFDQEEVRRNIEIALDAQPYEPGVNNPYHIKLDNETQAKVDNIKRMVKGDWAIYVLPNGHLDVVHSIDSFKYKKKLEQYEQAMFAAGGLIMFSENGAGGVS